MKEHLDDPTGPPAFLLSVTTSLMILRQPHAQSFVVDITLLIPHAP